ncbi:hypothetical protein [Luteitalea sp.]|uniref:hypothetical protein n=1 Tax=Luteitalea sp. TaxID=2004800 RepID=UPI0025B85FA9|nr:hypothetical protein [Luteitalea sp.]
MMETLRQRGIAGLIDIPNGRELYTREFIIDQTARRSVGLAAAAAPMDIPLMFFSAPSAERLFASSGKTMAEALTEADRPPSGRRH